MSATLLRSAHILTPHHVHSNFIGMEVYDVLVTSILPDIERNVQWLEGEADPDDLLQFVF